MSTWILLVVLGSLIIIRRVKAAQKAAQEAAQHAAREQAPESPLPRKPREDPWAPFTQELPKEGISAVVKPLAPKATPPAVREPVAPPEASKKHKFNVKEAIIYSEILKPKFEEFG